MDQKTAAKISAFEFSIIQDTFRSLVDEGLPEFKWVAEIEYLIVAMTGSGEIDPEMIACLIRSNSKLKPRRIDTEKFDRADRESRKILNAERILREAKTRRLREQRLAFQAMVQPGAHTVLRRTGVKDTQPHRDKVVAFGAEVFT